MLTRKTVFPRKTTVVRIDYEPGPDDNFEAIHETATLRELSGTTRDQFEMSAFHDKDGKRVVDTLYLRARLVALCLIDGDGKRVWNDDEITQLSDEYPASVVNTLFAAAQKLNGLDAGAAEDAEKNSLGQSGVSTIA
jgi:hypothetical protein